LVGAFLEGSKECGGVGRSGSGGNGLVVSALGEELLEVVEDKRVLLGGGEVSIKDEMDESK
jgi:hypothetical protein